MVIVNKQRRLFWAKRIGQPAWQFQRGLQGETAEQAMYRELKEEVGLSPQDVVIVTSTRLTCAITFPHLTRHYSQTVMYWPKAKMVFVDAGWGRNLC